MDNDATDGRSPRPARLGAEMNAEINQLGAKLLQAEVEAEAAYKAAEKALGAPDPICANLVDRSRSVLVGAGGFLLKGMRRIGVSAAVLEGRLRQVSRSRPVRELLQAAAAEAASKAVDTSKGGAHDGAQDPDGDRGLTADLEIVDSDGDRIRDRIRDRGLTADSGAPKATGGALVLSA
jgi:hypothetical protein